MLVLALKIPVDTKQNVIVKTKNTIRILLTLLLPVRKVPCIY